MKQITCPHCADTYPDFDAAHVCSRGPYAPKLKPKMNERIKELIEKAEDPEHGFIIPEKFAELIVRECSEQVMSIGRYNTPSGITPDLAIAISVGLKKHFGVKE